MQDRTTHQESHDGLSLTRPASVANGRARQRGAALIIALLFALTVLGLSYSLTVSSVSQIQQKRKSVARDRAAAAAESGMLHFLASLNGSSEQEVIANRGLTGSLMGDDDSDRAIRYIVKISPAGSDGYDNDLDGLIDGDDPDEGSMYEIVSVGAADGVHVAVSTTVRRLSSQANMHGAVVWNNNKLQLQLDSTGDQTFLLISGYDTDLNGSPTGLVKPGIGVNGAVGPLMGPLPTPRYDSDIIGTGGNFSIMNTTPLEPFDHQGLIDYARVNHDVRLDKQGYQQGVSKPFPWGTPTSPMVVYAKGDYIGDHVDIDDRNIIGAGLLVIDGSLEVADSSAILDWKGIVIIRSKLLIDSEAQFTVIGGMAMHGPKESQSQIDDATVTIQYSSEAVSRAMSVISESGYTMFNWREAAVPPSIATELDAHEEWNLTEETVN